MAVACHARNLARRPRPCRCARALNLKVAPTRPPVRDARPLPSRNRDNTDGQLTGSHHLLRSSAIIVFM